MRSTILIASAFLLAVAPDPTGDPTFQHPLLKEHGPIVALPDAAEPPRKDSQVLLDLTSDELQGDVLKGLDRAAVIVNLYAQQRVGLANGMKMAVVIHGPATRAVLKDDAYARHAGDVVKIKNPNRNLIKQLREAGVEIYVCGQALARQKYRTDEVLSEVVIAVSAATAHVNKQMDGYVLVP